MISIRELLLEGRSSVVVPGASLDEVGAALGEPTNRSDEPPLILVYGRLQLTFRRRELVLAAYYDGHRQDDERITVDVPATQEDIEALLVAEGAAYSRDAMLSYDDYTALHVERSGASVNFQSGALLGIQVPAEDAEPRAPAAWQ
jgi:hypothetical protein